MSDTGPLRELPLRHMHEEAGARFAPFAGWSMPVSYSLGVMKEHLHTREQAGLFDISHMRLIRISGPDAATLVARASPLEAESQAIGASKYTFLLNEDAGIIDDLIVTRLAADRFMVVANASRAAIDEAQLRCLASGLNVQIEPLDRVFLALQGPQAAEVMKDSGIETHGLTFMHGLETGDGWFLTRSGYTGEDGFEIALPASDAETLAGKLLADERVEWIGLAARDSLRLEAGLCLYGNDLDEQTDPASAGLVWAIPKPLRGGGGYAGAEKLAEIISAGPRKKRVGLQPEGRQPVRDGATLTDPNGKAIGRVTSGGFGPSVGHPVAMGYVPPDLAEPGTAVQADVRGKPVAMKIVKLPFITKRSKG
ncbi:glycine cleavage system aminomethyltransferase GcvT [Oricola cellulosilytica]|uniref:aminomethyltransferase n=1 Tax=Oricola cellulosilytica TaxID=1429082 RepID=A0A4R0PAE8_9HYPH|nr:glycine cleavage system aminomethyltransferase GcvT [Oricola cellulosilytica]TCD14221.1 glycine cleavage system aminomethyltransferase GcvT [Oricola cellulosilytica]